MRSPLPPVSAQRVKLTQRLLDSGKPAEADEVLDEVDQLFRLHPEVLEARIAFNVCLRRIEEAAEIARLLERLYPERNGVIEHQLARFPMSPEPRGSIRDTFKPV